MGHEGGQLGVVLGIVEGVSGGLTEAYLELGKLVVEVGMIMVEMLLEKVEEHADMGGTMDILELMAGELGHDNRLVGELAGQTEEKVCTN